LLIKLSDLSPNHRSLKALDIINS